MSRPALALLSLGLLLTLLSSPAILAAATCDELAVPGQDAALGARLVVGPLRAPSAMAAAGFDPLRQLRLSDVRAQAKTTVGFLRVESASAAAKLPLTPRPAVVYHFFVLETDAPTTAFLATGGTGGVEVRLNNATLLRRAGRRLGDEDTELSRLELEKGPNLLSVRYFQAEAGPWRTSVRLLGTGLGQPPPGVRVRVPGGCGTAEAAVTTANEETQPELPDCGRDGGSWSRCRVPGLEGRARVLRLGHRSRVDGRIHPYVLYTPAAYREGSRTPFPLVVALHGLGGTPLAFLKTALGIVRGEHTTAAQFETLPAELPSLGAFILAPEGMGSSGYRSYGEAEVLEAMADVMARFPIDRDRVSLTGASMGGTGAALLGLRYADLFSVAAPLCGYHDVRLYSDISGAALQPFERHLVEAWSSFEWARGGRHLPLRVVHGTKDGPSQSQALVSAYRQLGFSVDYDTPALGHNVWDLTYAGARFVRELAGTARVSHPRRVSVRTTLSAPARSHWLRLDAAARSGEWTELEGHYGQAGVVSVLTRNAEAFSIARDGALFGAGLDWFELDGQRLQARDCPPVLDPFEGAWPSPPWRPFAEAVHSFHKQDGAWRCGPAPACSGFCKTPQLAGPIPEAFARPLLFVYGTADPEEEQLAKRLAAQLAVPKRDITLRLPIKADTEVTDEELATHSVALVGTVAGNRLLARIADQLAIDVRPGSVSGRTFAHRGDALSAVWVQQSPFARDQYLIVYTGTGPRGLFHTPHLPQLLPDYVVYDATDWPYTKGRILRGRPVLEAGFFDERWRLPPAALSQNPYLTATPK